MELKKIVTPQSVQTDWLLANSVALDVLRIDNVHPVVSGNKWFKLKYYIEDAVAIGYRKILTFGGCFSNHIVATAFATKALGIESIGIIRGDSTSIHDSFTLQEAANYGMQLQFVTREAYRYKNQLLEKYLDAYCINEGGYGFLGAKGAREILQFVSSKEQYDFIVLAVGTGTTMAGLIEEAGTHQKVIGISTMKNNYSLDAAVRDILSEESLSTKQFEIKHTYHHGGYAKKSESLLSFMNETYKSIALPLDFVYTGKAFYAINDLVNRGEIFSGAKVLFVHTGGLQGNRSLKKGELIF